jgi:hypothetical protein
MTQPDQTLTSVEATLNYAGPTNGKPYFGLEAYESNINFEPHQVLIYDARPIQNQFSLDREGFVLVKHASAAAADPRITTANVTHEMGHNEINDAYHHEVAEFLRQLTGAREVIGQTSGLIVRTSLQAKKRTWAPPAGFVHLDFVLRGRGNVSRSFHQNGRRKDRSLSTIRRLSNVACSFATASR